MLDAKHVRCCTGIKDGASAGVASVTRLCCGWSRGLLLLCLIDLVIIIVNFVVVRSYFLFFVGVALHVASHGVGTSGFIFVTRFFVFAGAAGVSGVYKETV